MDLDSYLNIDLHNRYRYYQHQKNQQYLGFNNGYHSMSVRKLIGCSFHINQNYTIIKGATSNYVKK